MNEIILEYAKRKLFKCKNGYKSDAVIKKVAAYFSGQKDVFANTTGVEISFNELKDYLYSDIALTAKEKDFTIEQAANFWKVKEKDLQKYMN